MYRFRRNASGSGALNTTHRSPQVLRKMVARPTPMIEDATMEPVSLFNKSSTLSIRVFQHVTLCCLRLKHPPARIRPRAWIR